MKSNTARVVIGIAAVVAAVVLLILLKDDGGDSTDKSDATPTKPAPPVSGDQAGSKKEPSTPAIPTIVVKDGKPVGGVQELTFNEGDQVRFKVRSNESDEVHVHGYDTGDEVPAGGSATISFPASIEGIFEVELHGSEELIAELRVNP